MTQNYILANVYAFFFIVLVLIAQRVFNESLDFVLRDGEARFVTGGYSAGGPSVGGMLGESPAAVQMMEERGATKEMLDKLAENGEPTERFLQAERISFRTDGFLGAKPSLGQAESIYSCTDKVMSRNNVDSNHVSVNREIHECTSANVSFAGYAIEEEKVLSHERVAGHSADATYRVEVLTALPLFSNVDNKTLTSFKGRRGEGPTLEFNDRLVRSGVVYLPDGTSVGELEGQVMYNTVPTNDIQGMLVAPLALKVAEVVLRKLARRAHVARATVGNARLTILVPVYCVAMPRSIRPSDPSRPEDLWPFAREQTVPMCTQTHAGAIFVLETYGSRSSPSGLLPMISLPGLAFHLATRTQHIFQQSPYVEIARSFLAARIEATAAVNVRIVVRRTRISIPIAALRAAVALIASMFLLAIQGLWCCSGA